MDNNTIEKYSSAVTLSDMEVFVFPELMYALLLANIMSPAIWEWRKLDSFKKISKGKPYKKFMRLKQFVMDEFEFNLDLETWGLTSKARELQRFSKHILPEQIAQSNGLFGYEGDKYYFDVDIRKHFGLDAYDSDVIPYWKTETVEAMNAFRYKKGYRTGAGECVSLSSLYMAAAFVVCSIPLENMYIVLTPLHSQNYLDIDDGIITNNRRIVTKSMWFNGTELSLKAQRALRNERVTVVSHCSGYVHCIYDDATIEPAAYKKLTDKLRSFCSADIDMFMFANFLRAQSKYQKYVQFCKDCHGQARFVKAECLYAYEHGSDLRIGDHTHELLLDEVHSEDYFGSALPGRIRCDEFQQFIVDNKIDMRKEADRENLKQFVASFIPEAGVFVAELDNFLRTEPMLPSVEKNYIPSKPIKILPEWDRFEVIDYLESIRKENTVADLAFYAYRDMTRCEWEPFIKAAVERNPVSVAVSQNMDIDQAYNWLVAMPDESIYDGSRLAQPDELANYGRGDGIEKAITLANIILARYPDQNLRLVVDGANVVLKNEREYSFSSTKNLQKELQFQQQGCAAERKS